MKLEEKHQIKINFRGQVGLSFDDFSYIVTEQKDEKALEGKTKEPRHSKRAPRVPREPRVPRGPKAEIIAESKTEAIAEPKAETIVDPNQAIKDTPKNEGEQLAVPVEELDQPVKEAGEEDKETAPRTKRPRRKYVRRSPNSRKPGPPRGRRRRKPESESSTQTGTEGSTQGEGTSEQPQAASEQPISSDGNSSSSGENRVETSAPSVAPVESVKPIEKIVKKDDFQPPPISSTTEERAVE